MTKTVISVEDLSKSYRLGVIGTGTFYGDLKRWWAMKRGQPDPYRKVGETDRGESDGATIWALRDIDFTVQEGEAIGIIGRNGAGKSTLLKILSRVTAPTSGVIRIKGRIASLLEVGTGFHPELTGRENVYLNGAILGMSRREVRGKFDEIVDFSGVEKFIDTPVKRYSSGMYVRLAFAVAAHLEPEILIVDEVLAVGDAEFQKRCLGKMNDVAHKGRTVLFVSHNMAAVAALCSRACLFHGGNLIENGNVNSVIGSYLETMKSPERISVNERTDRGGDGTVRVTDLRILNEKGDVVDAVRSGHDVSFSIDYLSLDGSQLHNVKVGIGIYTVMGNFLVYCSNELVGVDFKTVPAEGRIFCTIPRIPLAAGQYYLNISFLSKGILADWISEALLLQVVESDFFGTGKLPPATHGGLLISQQWRIASSAPVNLSEDSHEKMDF